jgi:ABC-type nickel/cobalt efflux system permease component RcnA
MSSPILNRRIRRSTTRLASKKVVDFLNLLIIYSYLKFKAKNISNNQNNVRKNKKPSEAKKTHNKNAMDNHKDQKSLTNAHVSSPRLIINTCNYIVYLLLG